MQKLLEAIAAFREAFVILADDKSSLAKFALERLDVAVATAQAGPEEGYRWLGVGDSICAGDEWYDDDTGIWRLAHCTIKVVVSEDEDRTFRRRE